MATVNDRESGKIERKCKGSYCDSPFTVALPSMPPSGREGDHEVVEGARGRRSRAKDIVKGGYGIRPYGKPQSDGHFQPQTTLSLRRQAKFHTAGISFADSGKFRSPKANFTVQSPRGGCTPEDHEVVEGARGTNSRSCRSRGRQTAHNRMVCIC